MDEGQFAAVAAEFAAFHREFAPLFRRGETARRSRQYLTGLLVQGAERRNAGNLAEAVEGASARALQRLLSEAAWPDRAVRDRLQRHLAPRLSAPDGVFILDETGFAKQGRKSAGVPPGVG